MGVVSEKSSRRGAVCGVLLVISVVGCAVYRDRREQGRIAASACLFGAELAHGTVRLWETELYDGAPGGSTKTRAFTRRGCGLARAKRKGFDFAAAASQPLGKVRIDRAAKDDHEIVGFGGAFTEAAALTWSKLPEVERERVIEAYWGESGLHYSLGRVHMNSCDFCVGSYSFASVEGDHALEHFDDEVTHDQATMIPLMRAAKKKASKRDSPFALFASPWSPPAWLKAPNKLAPLSEIPTELASNNRSMLSSADPLGLAEGWQNHRTWATYFAKFASAYAKHGLELWGVTVQNEPEFSAPWEACRWNSSATGAFIRDHLGPVLREQHPELLIFAFDHNRDHLDAWTAEIYGDAETASFMAGMAFHWYAGGLDRTLDGALGHANVARARDTMRAVDPKGLLLPSEGCNCPSVLDSSLLRAERYAHDILTDLHHGSCGWVDWNLLLDHKGGPNHLGNECDAPIVAADANFSTVKLQSYYDVIGHFSRHIPPGSKKLDMERAGQGRYLAPYDSAGSHAAVGFETTLWGCEGQGGATPRQHWVFDDGELRLVDYTITDKWKVMCLSEKNDKELQSVGLVNCQYGRENEGTAVGAFAFRGTRIIETKAQKCLAPRKDRAAEEGVQLELADCDDHDPYQHWIMDDAGQITSAVDGRCVTAGWPFFMAVAFETPASEVVVVVVNEADIGTTFTIELEETVVFADIPPHTIQTFHIN